MWTVLKHSNCLTLTSQQNTNALSVRFARNRSSKVVLPLIFGEDTKHRKVCVASCAEKFQPTSKCISTTTTWCTKLSKDCNAISAANGTSNACNSNMNVLHPFSFGDCVFQVQKQAFNEQTYEKQTYLRSTNVPDMWQSIGQPRCLQRAQKNTPTRDLRSLQMRCLWSWFSRTASIEGTETHTPTSPISQINFYFDSYSGALPHSYRDSWLVSMQRLRQNVPIQLIVFRAQEEHAPETLIAPEPGNRYFK